MTTPHPEADILRAIADGKAIESRDESTSMAGAWNPATAETVLAYLANRNHRTGVIRFRIRPPTVRIGEFDVPEPVRKAPLQSQPYWVACPWAEGFVMSEEWGDCSHDLMRLTRGFVYASRADAEIAGRAIAALFAPS